MAENTKMRESTEFVEMESKSSCKKRKLCSELENEDHDGVESPESSTAMNNEKESNGVVKKSLRLSDLETITDDLKFKGSETEISTSMDGFSREVTPTSELSGESESSSTSNKKSQPKPRRRIQTATMPSEAELEEFFAAEEKYQQKQFEEKYNFDVVNDVPLEGKYQWVRLHP